MSERGVTEDGDNNAAPPSPPDLGTPDPDPASGPDPAPDPGSDGRWPGGRLVTAGLLGAVLVVVLVALGALAARSGDDDGDEPLTPGDGHPDLSALDEVGPDGTSSEPDATGSPGLAAVPACVQSEPGGPAFRLVFADDFDGPEVDQAAWYLYDSVGNAGFGLRRPAAIATDGGRLVITAQMLDGNLVSGGMAHLSPQTYGRWEFRVRTDPDPSAATSGVVLTWPTSGNWPIDGENDMYETTETPSRTPFSTFIHYGADNRQEILVHDADGTQWQEMAMEWTPERITMFRNGQFAGEITNREAIPHVPHHMTIQLDAWKDAMGDPVTMEVDWVRVYRWEEGGRC